MRGEQTKAASRCAHLSRAGSIMSGLLVAAIRYTDWRPSVPSISVNSWFTTLSVDWFTSEPRLGARASSSSKKRTHGEAARALVNSCLTARSLSPTYLFSNSGPWIGIHTPISKRHDTLGLSPILCAVIRWTFMDKGCNLCDNRSHRYKQHQN